MFATFASLDEDTSSKSVAFSIGRLSPISRVFTHRKWKLSGAYWVSASENHTAPVADMTAGQNLHNMHQTQIMRWIYSMSRLVLTNFASFRLLEDRNHVGYVLHERSDVSCTHTHTHTHTRTHTRTHPNTSPEVQILIYTAPDALVWCSLVISYFTSSREFLNSGVSQVPCLLSASLLFPHTSTLWHTMPTLHTPCCRFASNKILASWKLWNKVRESCCSKRGSCGRREVQSRTLVHRGCSDGLSDTWRWMVLSQQPPAEKIHVGVPNFINSRAKQQRHCSFCDSPR